MTATPVSLDWWHVLIGRCSGLRSAGCLLAWVLVQCVGMQNALLKGRFLASVFEGVRLPLGVRPRQKGAIFPLRLGDLREIEKTLREHSLETVESAAFAEENGLTAWIYVVFTGLNGLAESARPLPEGRWSAMEKQVFACVKEAVEHLLQLEVKTAFGMNDIEKDVREKRVTYGGEERGKMHPLTLEQVVPALPPVGHGGSIELVDFVSEGTKEFLLHPERLLKEVPLEGLPKLQGKVHCNADNQLALGTELVKRGICVWTPLEKVFSYKGQKVLSGLFGVEKNVHLEDSRPILRLIMNLVPINSLMVALQGRVRGLPSVTSWMSTCVDEDETVFCWQADMVAAFYLFRVPDVWARYLSFNLLAEGSTLNLTPGVTYALSCAVLPMGWSSSVAVMQEAAERILWQADLPESNQ